MSYAVQFTPRAHRDFAALDRNVQRRLTPHINRLAENPFPPGYKRLHADEPFFRLRVGDYRMIYQVEGKRLTVIIVKVGHRRDVYR